MLLPAIRHIGRVMVKESGIELKHRYPKLTSVWSLFRQFRGQYKYSRGFPCYHSRKRSALVTTTLVKPCLNCELNFVMKGSRKLRKRQLLRLPNWTSALILATTPGLISPRGGVLPYMGYIGMCRCEGYDFQAAYSGIGYINQSVSAVWV